MRAPAAMLGFHRQVLALRFAVRLASLSHKVQG